MPKQRDPWTVSQEPRITSQRSATHSTRGHSTQRRGGYSCYGDTGTAQRQTPHPPFCTPRLCGAPRMLLVRQKMLEIFSLGHK
jgi:hypothetical protein